MKKILAICLLTFLASVSIGFAAAFTSSQTGDWDDGATWGNASPGAKGTDWPGNAGDTFTIANGHTVTYNVSETNELGDSTIQSGGILTFKTDSNTKITFGNNTFTIDSGGTLNVGTSGTPIPDGTTAEIIFNCTSDDSKGLTSNGTLTMYGDEDYYGAAFNDTLANDAENTDGDAAIKTSTDMSAKWNANDYVVIHEHKQHDSYTTDTIVRKINSFDGGDGTIVNLDGNVTCAAGVGSSWTSYIINVSRNVKYYQLGEVPDGSCPTNKPFFRFNSNTELHDIQVYACEGLERGGTYGSNGTANVSNAAIGDTASSYFGFDGGDTLSDISSFGTGTSLATLDGCVVDGGYLYGGVRVENRVRGDTLVKNTIFIGGGSGLYGSSATYENCTFAACSTLNLGVGIVYKDCYFYGYDYLLNKADQTYINCTFGWDADDNQIDCVFSDINLADEVAGNYDFINCKVPSGGLTFTSTRNNQSHSGHYLRFEYYDQTANAHRIYSSFGATTKVPCDGTGDYPSQDPDGSTGDAIEATALSNCDDPHNVRIFEHEYWKTAAAYTVTYKLQTTYASLGAGDIKMEIDYLDGSGDVQTATEEATAVTTRSNAADWTQSISDTFTVGTEGWVRIRLYLQDYESNDELYVWPEASWS